MKINLEVKSLLKALSEFTGIIGKKTTKPILSNILITSKGDQIELCATDSVLYMSKFLPAEVEIEGSITVPYSELSETTKKLHENSKLSLQLDAGRLILTCDGFKGSLPTLESSNFPEKYTGSFDSSFKISQESLRFLIAKTEFAICNDETRYNLNGIYLHEDIKDNSSELKAVATDGHKLALAKIALDEKLGLEEGIIIPRKTVNTLKAILDGEKQPEVQISINKNLVAFNHGQVTLFSHLIDSKFPDYKRVIPESQSFTVPVSKEKLLYAIGLVSIYSDDKIKSVKLNIEGNLLIINATKGGEMSGEQRLPLSKSYNNFSIIFNSTYLYHIVGIVDEEEVSFSLDQPTSPVLISPQNTDNYLFVLMPMRL